MRNSTVTGKDPRIQTCGPSLLQNHDMSVHHEGELVIFRVKNVEMKMDYPTALTLARMLFAHGKQAKKFAGDFSLTTRSIAVLTDAEQHERKNW